MSKKFSKCCYCERKLDVYLPQTKEHIVPMSKGGNGSSKNLKPCCQSCNFWRGNKDYQVWLDEIFKYKLNRKNYKDLKHDAHFNKIIRNINKFMVYVSLSASELLSFKSETKRVVRVDKTNIAKKIIVKKATPVPIVKKEITESEYKQKLKSKYLYVYETLNKDADMVGWIFRNLIQNKIA